VGQPRRGRVHVTKRLLSPFVRCGACNAKMTGASRKDRRTGERIVLYKCPQKGLGGCGRVSRTAAPIDAYITALVLMEQSKIALRKLEEVPPWDGEAELKAVLGQIKETTQAYEGGMISGGRYFPMLARFEAKESALRAARRRYEEKRQARVEAATNLDTEWNRPDFTLEQKQAAIAKSLTAVVIHPAPRPGAKFTPDQITPVWRQDED
jgi:Recombinase zinc beta ribbon domain